MSSESTNHHNNDRNLAMQAVSNAVNAANAWKAHVPFLLSDSPESKNYSMIDIFSMVNPVYMNGLMYEKELFFSLRNAINT